MVPPSRRPRRPRKPPDPDRLDVSRSNASPPGMLGPRISPRSSRSRPVSLQQLQPPPTAHVPPVRAGTAQIPDILLFSADIGSQKSEFGRPSPTCLPRGANGRGTAFSPASSLALARPDSGPLSFILLFFADFGSQKKESPGFLAPERRSRGSDTGHALAVLADCGRALRQVSCTPHVFLLFSAFFGSHDCMGTSSSAETRAAPRVAVPPLVPPTVRAVCSAAALSARLLLDAVRSLALLAFALYPLPSFTARLFPFMRGSDTSTAVQPDSQPAAEPQRQPQTVESRQPRGTSPLRV